MAIQNTTSVSFSVQAAGAGSVSPRRDYFNQLVAGLKAQPLRMLGAKPLTSDVNQTNENTRRDCSGLPPRV